MQAIRLTCEYCSNFYFWDADLTDVNSVFDPKLKISVTGSVTWPRYADHWFCSKRCILEYRLTHLCLEKENVLQSIKNLEKKLRLEEGG